MSAPIGQLTERLAITNISSGFPCEITTDLDHHFANKSFVRITDINSAIPVLRGMDELNNGKFRIIVTGTNTFFIQDPITFEFIDSTNYPPYVEGGSCNLVQETFIYYPSADQVFPN